MAIQTGTAAFPWTMECTTLITQVPHLNNTPTTLNMPTWRPTTLYPHPTTLEDQYLIMRGLNAAQSQRVLR